jgi:predicted transcriptional regulator
MRTPRLTKLEVEIMNALWDGGPLSVREIQERLPAGDRSAYTTIQTVVYRLEAKKAIRRVKKVGNAYVFEPAITRKAAQRRLIDELLGLFGGSSEPVMSHLIESGKLTLDDLRDAERTFRRLAKKEKGE